MIVWPGTGTQHPRGRAVAGGPGGKDCGWDDARCPTRPPTRNAGRNRAGRSPARFPTDEAGRPFSPGSGACWNTRPVICTCMSHSSFASSGRVCKSAMSFWPIAALFLRGHRLSRFARGGQCDALAPDAEGRFALGALGQGERLVTLTKPAQRTSAWSAAESAALLPSSLFCG